MERLSEALLRLRLQREWTQEELAVRAGPSVETISNIERGLVMPQGLTVRKLLRALGADPAQFEAYLEGRIRELDDLTIRSDRDPGGAAAPDHALVALARSLAQTSAELARRLGSPQPARTTESAPLPAALRPELIRPARAVPEFPIGVAASRRVEKISADHADAFRMIDTEDLRVFTAPVDGDCMEPKWRHGEIAVFSYDAFEREGVLLGRSYYLAFTDGTSTFKRLFTDPQEPDLYVLRCWNAARYPDARRVHYSEVVRIARAVSKVVVPEEEE